MTNDNGINSYGGDLFCWADALARNPTSPRHTPSQRMKSDLVEG